MRIFFFLFFMIGLVSFGYSQSQGKATLEYDKQYKKNIRKSYIRDVYIPKNVVEACKELEQLSTPEALAKFKSGEEEVVTRKLHFGLGRWIMVKWNFDQGSRYSHYLKELGVTKLDDKIDFTISSFHRYISGKDLDIYRRAKEIRDLRRKEYEEKMASRKLIKEETRSVKKQN